MHDPAGLSTPASVEADRPEVPAPSLEALPLWRLAIAVCALTALLLPASPGFFAHVDADILLSTEVSLLRWTPYYWGQHRFGMLLPLLAMPVREPVANLLVQMALSTFAALFSVVLGARLLFGRREALFAALVAILAAVVVLPAPVFFHLASLHPYGPSLALGFGGLLLLERPRWWTVLLGGVLVLVAHWVNTGAALVLGPLAGLRVAAIVAGRALGAEPFRRWWWTPAWLGPPLVLIGMRLILRFTTGEGSEFATADAGLDGVAQLPPELWDEAWWSLGQNVLTAVGWTWVWCIAASLVAGLVVIAAERPRQRAASAYLLTLGALTTALMAVAITATVEWVSKNLFAFRYAVPAIALVHLAAFSLPWLVMARAARVVRLAAPGVAVAILVAAVVRYGVPSSQAIEARLAPARPYAEALRTTGATHFIGSYWTVWPALFELQRLGETRPVFPLTDRGQALKPLWEAMPREQVLIARPHGDPDAHWWFQVFGLEGAVVVGRTEQVELLRVPPR